jgi:hypothetical protein
MQRHRDVSVTGSGPHTASPDHNVDLILCAERESRSLIRSSAHGVGCAFRPVQEPHAAESA